MDKQAAWRVFCNAHWNEIVAEMEAWTALVVKDMKTDGSFNTPISKKEWKSIHKNAIKDIIHVTDAPIGLWMVALADPSIEDCLFQGFCESGCLFDGEVYDDD